jgi:hypothetical protein
VANNPTAKPETTRKQSNAFITTRKRVCYLTVKCARHNCHIMRIRNYTIDADDKCRMRRLHPDAIFDWKKLTRQLAEKRELCRRYRSRRLYMARLPRERESFFAVYDPATRTVYADEAGPAAALLDAILDIDAPSNMTHPHYYRPRCKLTERNQDLSPSDGQLTCKIGYCHFVILKPASMPALVRLDPV